MDPAIRQLLAVVRCRDAGGAEALSAALSAADWGELLRAAEAHRMLGLTFRRSTDFCRDAPPPSAQSALSAAYRASSTRALRQEARLLDVITRLDAAGVPAVPLKGPLLSTLVYGEAGLRYSSDLDVLVRVDDFPTAARTLAASGWCPASQAQVAQHGFLEEAECELLLEHPGTGLFLELHWRTGSRFGHASLPAEPLIARAEPCELLGRSVRCLRDDDHFLVLCMHGATHVWGHLELIGTVAELLTQGRVADWGDLLRRARALGCRRRVLVAAALARGLAGVILPEAVEAELAGDEGAERLARQAAAALEAVPGPRSSRRRLYDLVWQSACLDSTPARLRHLLARVFVPGVVDLDWMPLPRPLFGVYYVLRPLRLMAQHARGAVRSG